MNTYTLIYNANTKAVQKLLYGTQKAYTLLSVLRGLTTYAEVQAFCTTNSLTGLPAQQAGQP